MNTPHRHVWGWLRALVIGCVLLLSSVSVAAGASTRTATVVVHVFQCSGYSTMRPTKGAADAIATAGALFCIPVGHTTVSVYERGHRVRKQQTNLKGYARFKLEPGKYSIGCTGAARKRRSVRGEANKVSRVRFYLLLA